MQLNDGDEMEFDHVPGPSTFQSSSCHISDLRSPRAARRAGLEYSVLVNSDCKHGILGIESDLVTGHLSKQNLHR